MKKLFFIAAAAVMALPQAANADVAFGFEFNTPGVDEGWQHNGATNGGASDTTGPTAITVAGTGEGVLTAQQLPGNGDLRVLHNPDLALDTGLFTGWDSIEVRFRQLDGLNGSPQALAGSLGNMWLGITSTGGNTNITGADFVEETAGDTEFWYTATLDISGAGTSDIGQIRFDPIASSALDYQLDYVRVNAFAAVPEPSSMAVLGLAGLAIFTRRRK